MNLTDHAAELQLAFAQLDLLLGTSRQGKTLLLEKLLIKMGALKLKMYQEPGHKLPHIHIDYGQANHVASYSISPAERIAGTLDRRYDKAVVEWIESRKDALLALWEVFQTGGDSSALLANLAGDP